MKTPPLLLLLAVPFASLAAAAAETVAFWPFDEPAGLYPSTPLEPAVGLDAPLVLGLGGTVVPGKFGQALSTEPYPPVAIPAEGEATASLARRPVPPGRVTADHNSFTIPLQVRGRFSWVALDSRAHGTVVTIVRAERA